MIITISREFGAGALAVAEGVAAQLGYLVVADQVPAIVAARLGISPEHVDAEEDTPQPLLERILSGFEKSSPEVSAPIVTLAPRDFGGTTRREVEATIREYADRDRVVIVGRVASMILAGRPNLLRVFLHAPREWRIARAVEWLGLDPTRAAAEVDRLDVARRAYAREHYGLSWGDARFYDLTVNTARCGIEGAVEVVVAAARAAAGAAR